MARYTRQDLALMKRAFDQMDAALREHPLDPASVRDIAWVGFEVRRGEVLLKMADETGALAVRLNPVALQALVTGARDAGRAAGVLNRRDLLVQPGGHDRPH